MFYSNKNGLVEVICGPMFSGKTEKIIQIIKKLKKMNKKILVFKSYLDRRFSDEQKLISHNKNYIECFIISKSDDILSFVEKDTEFVIIDEVQFLDDRIVDIVEILSDKNIKVILAGLDLDFRGKPFGPMPFLLSISDKIIKLKGICAISGEPANRTQRLVNNKPAKISDPIFMLEDIKNNIDVKYEPRSKKHHVIMR